MKNLNTVQSTESSSTKKAGNVSARLLDVFQLSGRGTVILIGEVSDTIHIGDCAFLNSVSMQVTGLELIHFSETAKSRKDAIGLLVDYPDSNHLRTMVGQELTLQKASTG